VTGEIATQTMIGYGVHPGTLLREYVLPALRLSVSQAARELCVTRQTLHRILAGQAAITPEMAVRLERFCGVSSHFWLDRQYRYELHRIGAHRGAVQSPLRRLPENIIRQMGGRHEG
jgi:addiction module HigA family antidote